MDESGSKATSSRFFVMAAVKLREPGRFARTIRDVRDRNHFEGEFKFSEITKGTLACYYDLIDQLEGSDAHLAACVDNSEVCNPFAGRDRPRWLVHAEVAAQLLVGCINRRELVAVLMDGISTPRRTAGESGNPNSNKAKVAARLAASFDCAGFADGRTGRVNTATYRGRRTSKPTLKVVSKSARAS